MPQEPLIRQEPIAQQAPEAQTIIRLLLARIAEQVLRIAALEAEVAALKKTPRNSSVPPSTEHPHAKTAPRKKSSGKKPGGQPGHPKHERALIPVEDCEAIYRRQTRELPVVRRTPGRIRSRAAAAPGLGHSRDQTAGQGIPTAPAGLLVLFGRHLRRASARRAPGACRAAAGRADSLAHGLLQAEQAPGAFPAAFAAPLGPIALK